MEANTTRRKLIDLRTPVFDALSVQAKKRGVSLKKYIETVLEEDAAQHRAPAPASVTDARILGLVGIARSLALSADPEDERAQYILSK